MANPQPRNIQNSRILITGGLGFVGSAIARRLLKEGAKEVRVFDQHKELPVSLEDAPNKNRLCVIPGDLRNAANVEEAVKGSDYVFHQAALRVTQCAKEPRLAHEVLIDGTFNVVQACIESGVKKIIHASSAIVYGEPLKLPLDENHPTHDTTLYGIFKVANENLLRSARTHHGLDYLALRCFNIYGPGLRLFGPETEVLVRWLDRLDAGLPPLIFGDGTQTLDWIFIDDVVEANWMALQSEKSGEAFNICTGRETSILELLNLVLKIYGSDLKPEFRENRTVNQVAGRFGNPEKAMRELGFKTKVPLESGLETFIRWREGVLAQKNLEEKTGRGV